MGYVVPERCLHVAEHQPDHARDPKGKGAVPEVQRTPGAGPGTVSAAAAGRSRREKSGRLLAIYLKDQLALGVLWRELARRAAEKNRGTPLGTALEQVASEISADVGTFESIMARLGVRPGRIKVSAAVVLERITRFKLNGRIFRRSPLSTFLELDLLTMGIRNKKQLWETLGSAAGLDGRLPDVDFGVLIARADRQAAELEPHRARGARVAFRSGAQRG